MSTDANTLAMASQQVMDIIRQNQQLDKMMVLSKLMEIIEIDINIVGEKYKILNQEILTEYTGNNMTKWMVKNETWRKSVQEVLHMKDINEEKLVGFMDAQVILKMKSNKRKGSQEIINALRNEVSGTEVIPSKTRTKRFFGWGSQ